MEIFACKTKVIAGNGALSALGQMQIKRLFLVTDPFFMKSGQAHQVAQLAKAE